MFELQEISRLPAPEDNCTIAIRKLEAGTAVRIDGAAYVLSHTILEGHRFAAAHIPSGGYLLSWGMPFGRALRDINPGEYVCNNRVLNELRMRSLDFDLPARPNFADDIEKYQFDGKRFQPAAPLPRKTTAATFLGFKRSGDRGVGTRNMLVLMGVNALVGGYVKQLEKESKPLLSQYEHVHGIVAVAHTEGSQVGRNNQELLLRTLAGFMVHPNVGAVLLFDAGEVGVTNRMLHEYAIKHSYPLDEVLHRFISLAGPFTLDIERGMEIINRWLPEMDVMHPTPQPLGELKIALQCGGSDAFSGISGNPLAAWVSQKVIQEGGSAVLAETDELIGAEAYLLDKVRDAETAKKFLYTVTRFQERAAWHGHSAQGNPTGGNRYRGLYNIFLKSLGAAVKRHPDVPLDFVIDYGEQIKAPGYYFMDSPGNDLESIAGQVASGCNLIFFMTGNGSITNFPFVPTIKIVTTSERYELLSDEMDVNAGAYLDGSPLEELGQAMLELTLDVASGQLSAGEKAKHAQVQIWRNWRLSGYDYDRLGAGPVPDGVPIPIQGSEQKLDLTFWAYQTERGIFSRRIGLILPSSLCSAQIANMAAQRLNERAVGMDKQISNYAALAHTEGCGNSTQPEFVDSMLGYLTHPLAASCLIVEHGCEITHNDFWRQQLRSRGINPDQFGWASVQLDGGIEQVLAKIDTWFIEQCDQMPVPETVAATAADINLGLMTDGDVDEETAVSLAQLVRQIAGQEGSIILPANDRLASNRAFENALNSDVNLTPTLAYANQPDLPGFHLMANPTDQWSETMTGLGAAGVEMILAMVSSRAQQGHPFIPVLRVVKGTTGSKSYYKDIDIILSGTTQEQLHCLMEEISTVLSREREPKLVQGRNAGFQITRGLLGVSL